MNTTTNDFDAYDAKMAAMAALEAEVLPRNKATLFDALAAARIAKVVVCFDGSGDSGQIESVDASDPDGASTELPNAKVDLREAVFGETAVAIASRSAREALEIMTYDFLEQTHDGWENGDGAHAEFTFDVAARSIRLDYDEHYVASTNYQHEF